MPNKGNSGEDMKQGKEQMKGVRTEVLDREGLSKHMEEIKELRYNPLNKALDRGSSTARKEELTEMRRELAVSEHHDVLIVAKEGDKIVGFLAIKKHVSEGKADLREMWTSMPNSQQRPLLHSLIQEAKVQLTTHEKTYLKLHISPEAPSTDLERVIHEDWKGFLEIDKKEEGPSDALKG